MEWNRPPFEITVENLTINVTMPPQTTPTDSGILGAIKSELDTIMIDLTQLTSDVAAETTVEQSAITLLNGISAQITAAVAASEAGDTTALTNLSTQIQTSSAALAASVTANTPAAPAA